MRPDWYASQNFLMAPTHFAKIRLAPARFLSQTAAEVESIPWAEHCSEPPSGARPHFGICIHTYIYMYVCTYINISRAETVELRTWISQRSQRQLRPNGMLPDKYLETQTGSSRRGPWSLYVHMYVGRRLSDASRRKVATYSQPAPPFIQPMDAAALKSICVPSLAGWGLPGEHRHRPSGRRADFGVF